VGSSDIIPLMRSHIKDSRTEINTLNSRNNKATQAFPPVGSSIPEIAYNRSMRRNRDDIEIGHVSNFGKTEPCGRVTRRWFLCRSV